MVVVPLQTGRDRDEHRGRQSHIEQTCSRSGCLLDLHNVLLEVLEILVLVVLTILVRTQLEKLLQRNLVGLGLELDVLRDVALKGGLVHLGARIADDVGVLVEVLILVEPKERREGLFLCKVTRCAED